MPYRYGYTVSTGQRLMGGPPGFTIGHMGALKYLFWRRMSPDVEDIPGHTALDHCTMALARADLARMLLEHGADVGHRDRFGSIPFVGLFQSNAIDVLMGFGAWVAGHRRHMRRKRKHAGESPPLDGKK